MERTLTTIAVGLGGLAAAAALFTPATAFA